MVGLGVSGTAYRGGRHPEPLREGVAATSQEHRRPRSRTYRPLTNRTPTSRLTVRPPPNYSGNKSAVPGAASGAGAAVGDSTLTATRVLFLSRVERFSKFHYVSVKQILLYALLNYCPVARA